MNEPSKRVVMTGMGTVNPLGKDVLTTWENMIAGKSGIGRITLFDPDTIPGLEVKIAGEVKNFDPAAILGKKEARRLDRFAQLAIGAATQAVTQSGLQIGKNANADRVGVSIPPSIGGIMSILLQDRVLRKKGADRVGPFTAPMTMPNAATAEVGILLGAHGIGLTPVSACATSTDAIGLAWTLLHNGSLDAMIVGGADAPLTETVIAAFQQAGALTKSWNHDPARASRPFTKNRDGFVAAEGATVFVLETLEHALRRGAQIFAEVAGWSATMDASHITSPDPSGTQQVRAIQMAMSKSDVRPEDIGYINTHGTSTPINDSLETQTIKTALGEYAYKIPVSSTKSMTGHGFGSTGALEALACIQTLQTGVLLPTINQDCADPDCDLDYIPNVARKLSAPPRAALSNSFGFGGHNACLVLKRWEE